MISASIDVKKPKIKILDNCEFASHPEMLPERREETPEII